jgi:hypothetical protein
LKAAERTCGTPIWIGQQAALRPALAYARIFSRADLDLSSCRLIAAAASPDFSN